MSRRAISRFSKVNLLLLKAEPISDAAGASVITIIRKGKKSCGAAVRGVRGKREEHSVDPKMKKEGEEVVRVSEKTFLPACGEDQKKLPQPMGNYGGADTYSAASGEPMPQQCTSSEGDCSPQTAHGEEPTLAGPVTLQSTCAAPSHS